MEDAEAEFVLGLPVAPQPALPLGFPLEELLLLGLPFVGLVFAEMPHPDSSANVKLAPKIKKKIFGMRRGPI
jgi:hypothetical protein